MKNRLSWLGFPLMLCASVVWAQAAQSVVAPKPQIMAEPVVSPDGQVIPYDGKKVIDAPVEKKTSKKASPSKKSTTKKSTKKSAKSSASTKAASPAKKSSKKSGKKH